MGYVATSRGLGYAAGYQLLGYCPGTNIPRFMQFPDGTQRCLTQAEIDDPNFSWGTSPHSTVQVPPAAKPVLTTGPTVDKVASFFPAPVSVLSAGGSISSYFDSALAWAKANPLYAALGAGAILFLVVKR